MKRLLPLILLLASISASAAINLQTCPTTPTTGGLMGCQKVAYAPVAPSTLVRSSVNSKQGWRPYSTLKPADSAYAEDGAWHVLSTIIVATTSVTPPPVNPPPPVIPATKDYTFGWVAPTQNWDGSPLTDLTAYLISNAGSSIGPFLTWVMVSASVTSYTYKALPTNRPQCFAIAGFSASSGVGQPVVFCQPGLSPGPGPVTTAKPN